MAWQNLLALATEEPLVNQMVMELRQKPAEQERGKLLIEAHPAQIRMLPLLKATH